MKVICFDLDDTLTKEIDYLESGYRAVSRLVEKRFGLDNRSVYENLLGWYKSGENAFEKLNQVYCLENPVSDYLNVYRYHQPEIILSEDARMTLSALKEKGVEIGIVSDGRQETQMNKVKALGLTEWMDESCIIINSQQEYFKPNPMGFDKFMLAMYRKTGESDLEFTYVGDNLKKDFLCPNQKNWDTVCLVDTRGTNIHAQKWNVSEEYLPKHRINSLMELVNLIGGHGRGSWGQVPLTH